MAMNTVIKLNTCPSEQEGKLRAGEPCLEPYRSVVEGTEVADQDMSDHQQEQVGPEQQVVADRFRERILWSLRTWTYAKCTHRRNRRKR